MEAMYTLQSGLRGLPLDLSHFENKVIAVSCSQLETHGCYLKNSYMADDK